MKVTHRAPAARPLSPEPLSLRSAACPRDPQTYPLILIGFKHSGKTSVGKHLATKLNCPFVDTDRLLETEHTKKTGEMLTCPDIYRSIGKDGFRALEKTVITNLATIEQAVIATGGGVILDPESMALFQTLGTLIYLSTSYDAILSRMREHPLPAYMQENVDQEFAAIFREREPLYQQYAHRIIVTDNRKVLALTDELYDLYGQTKT